ncbi:hypothetical protein BDB00DRAFT_818997 [Zychaea mexicana]|uniref:uncharacterized protein n=1 Tax=Zychaea mexicana TaxID=64656 RepID=UPI0022FEFC17|nr:uncharacterized protein BDB00DRAFT_818997 [Zychaea mexicana]KAI9494395.1 hypothetical protein BDB00DRAFT_818997 [Zychaea mexicana]
MASNPKRALILYSYANVGEHGKTPAVDALCQRGCGGQLMLERRPDSEHKEKGNERRQDIIQLLGLSGCSSIEQMKAQLTERFRSMKLGLIASCPSITALGDSLGLTIASSSSSSATKDIYSKEHLQAAIDRVDVLLVDVSDQPSEMDRIMTEVLESTSDLLKCIVMHATVQKQQQENMPLQSGVTKNGVPVDILERLVCAYWHDGSTRRDRVRGFTVQDIVANGCNGSILAWHYLAEIGHKLGHVPKYGA